MSKFIDLTDKKFGRLSVIMRVNDDKSGNRMWKCKCDCGNERIVSGAGLKRGASISCGCYRKEYLSKIKKKYNEYNLDGEYGIGYASNTNKEFYFDLEDYDTIKDYCWYESNIGYISGKEKNSKQIQLHKLITKTNGKVSIDHINRKRYDNRKENLRTCTPQQNCFNKSLQINNKSGYTGVCFDYSRNKWKASIIFNNKTIHLGRFDNKEDAINARLKAELKYFGEFSPNYNSLKEMED